MGRARIDRGYMGWEIEKGRSDVVILIAKNIILEVIMLYKLDKEKKSITKVKRTNFDLIGLKEKDLEDIVVDNVGELISENQLLVISQSIKFKEIADILALDKDGVLYIFELKRWKSNKENILQVLRYGQIFGQYTYDKLNDLFKNYNKSTKELEEVHFEVFEDLREKQLEKEEYNSNQKFIVITDGLDIQTLNAIKYWKEKGVDIDSLPYRTYEINNQYLFEFDKYNVYNDVLLDEDTGIYIVNTNKTYSDNNYKEMLEENKASAYYGRKNTIKQIKKGDKVYLYHTGIGIIAYGTARSEAKYRDYNDDKNAECYVELNIEWKIKLDDFQEKAIHSWEINKKLGSKHRFRQTCFSITEEFNDVIQKIYKEKNG